MEDDDEAHAEVAQQVRVEIRGEAAPPAMINPLAVWRELFGVLTEGVAEEELARHDDVERAIQLSGGGQIKKIQRLTVEKKIHQVGCLPYC